MCVWFLLAVVVCVLCGVDYACVEGVLIVCSGGGDCVCFMGR